MPSGLNGVDRCTRGEDEPVELVDKAGSCEAAHAVLRFYRTHLTHNG
jgi:hypothetical protein